MATGWTVPGSNPGGSRFSAPVQTGPGAWLQAGRSGDRIPVGTRFSAPVQAGPGAHPASCTMGAGSSPGVKSGRGVTLTPYPLLVPWSRKTRAIPLFPLWALRSLQSVSACTRVKFTFYFYVEECDVEAQLSTNWHLGTNEHECAYLPSIFSLNIERILDTPILLIHDISVYVLTYKHFNNYE